jgi:hypothetical protein
MPIKGTFTGAADVGIASQVVVQVHSMDQPETAPATPQSPMSP